jgi:hypothetical protein
LANPFLVLGGIAVGIVTAGFGILQVPGWISSAQDAAVMNDLANVRATQAAAASQLGSFLSSLDAPEAADLGLNSKKSDSTVSLSMTSTSDSWCAVGLSASGTYLAASNATTEFGKGATAEAAADEAGCTVVPGGGAGGGGGGAGEFPTTIGAAVPVSDDVPMLNTMYGYRVTGDGHISNSQTSVSDAGEISELSYTLPDGRVAYGGGVDQQGRTIVSTDPEWDGSTYHGELWRLTGGTYELIGAYTGTGSFGISPNGEVTFLKESNGKVELQRATGGKFTTVRALDIPAFDASNPAVTDSGDVIGAYDGKLTKFAADGSVSYPAGDEYFRSSVAATQNGGFAFANGTAMTFYAADGSSHSVDMGGIVSALQAGADGVLTYKAGDTSGIVEVRSLASDGTHLLWAYSNEAPM